MYVVCEKTVLMSTTSSRNHDDHEGDHRCVWPNWGSLRMTKVGLDDAGAWDALFIY